MTMKEIHERAKEITRGGITNMAKLRAAVPFVVEGTEQMRTLFKLCRETMSALKQASDKCAIFAQGNVDKLDACMTSANGVQSADITIDDNVYHVSFGYDGYKREDGDDLSQEFLETLPENWIKVVTQLSKSGINQENPSVEELRAHGLVQVAKNTWSLKTANDALDDFTA